MDRLPVGLGRRRRWHQRAGCLPGPARRPRPAPAPHQPCGPPGLVARWQADRRRDGTRRRRADLDRGRGRDGRDRSSPVMARPVRPVAAPAWSPDGKQIAFQRVLPAPARQDYDRVAIEVVDLATGATHVVASASCRRLRVRRVRRSALVAGRHADRVHGDALPDATDRREHPGQLDRGRVGGRLRGRYAPDPDRSGDVRAPIPTGAPTVSASSSTRTRSAPSRTRRRRRTCTRSGPMGRG